ncbi:MAG: ankyrin repeat domain-containing protein [Gemmatimonadota bacterium]
MSGAAPHGARDAFLRAACVPLDAAHGSGTLDEAGAILSVHPDLATLDDVPVACVLGDAQRVARLIAADGAAVQRKDGPHGWDALTHLCFSRYLRLDPARSDGFVEAARVLLDAGADANTGFYSEEHQPHPARESVLYGAAGVAHHPALTRLLLERGADPNDGETPYHAPEGYDSRAMQLVVESGRLHADGLTTMLHRKLDWHDLEGVRWLLDHGADPNRMSAWGRRALHQAVLRECPLDLIEALLERGADPALPDGEGRSALEEAERLGRAEVVRLLNG